METLTALFLAATIQFNLPPKLIDSVCFVETRHNVSVVTPNDGGTPSIGVCQVKMKTATQMGFKGTEEELLLPKNNVYFAAKYLHYQLKRYGGSTVKAVIAYNKGNAKGLTGSHYQAKVFKQWELAQRE